MGALRRRSMRSRYSKRRKVGPRSKIVKGAARGAARSYTGTEMCKDLGAFIPNCMVIKLRQHFVTGANNGATAFGTGGIATDRHGRFILNLIVTQSCLGNTTPDTGYSANNVLPVGLARLVGASGSTSMYTSCCVLRVQGSLKFSFTNPVAAVLTAPPYVAGQFLYRARDTSEGALTSPQSQAAADIQAVQPNTRCLDIARIQGTQLLTSGAIPTPTISIVQRIDHWIHNLTDQSFASYVSDPGSFAATAAAPSNYANVDCAWFFNSQNGTYAPPGQGVVVGSLVFTLLCKDPLATLL